MAKNSERFKTLLIYGSLIDKGRSPPWSSAFFLVNLVLSLSSARPSRAASFSAKSAADERQREWLESESADELP